MAQTAIEALAAELHPEFWADSIPHEEPCCQPSAERIIDGLRARGWSLAWNGVSDEELGAAFAAVRHPYTCGQCSWGRSPENHSMVAYQRHVLETHSNLPGGAM